MGPIESRQVTEEVAFLDRSAAHPSYEFKGSACKPRSIGGVTAVRVLSSIWDILTSLLPLSFLLLAIFAGYLDGKHTSPFGEKVERAIQISPTVFPIVFAALMGRFFRAVGLYQAERGSSLSTLERLVGCQSFFASVERQFCLRSLDLLGVSIVAVWLLSPLGGQAALRLLARSPQVKYSEASIHYLNSQSSIAATLLVGASAINSHRQDFEPVYLVSLISPRAQQESPLDVWGNIKVPMLPSLPSSSKTADASQWRSVDRSGNVSYSSLIGVPVTGLPNTAESNFTMLSMYWEAQCSTITLSQETNSTSICRIQAGEGYNASTSTRGCNTLAMRLDEAVRRDDNFQANRRVVHFSVYSRTEDTLPEFDPDAGSPVSIANCTLGYKEVESMVRCNRGSCQVDSMRDVTNTSDPRELDKYTGSSVPLSNMFRTIPSMGRSCEAGANGRGSTKLEKWMNDTSLVYGPYSSNYMSLYRLGPKVVSEKLTVALNTFWQATYATRYLGGSLPSVPSEFESLETWNVSTFLPATAHLTEAGGDVYVTDWRWVVLLVVASGVLEAAAVIALVLRYLTLAPDILGYVSSQTRDSPYVPLLPGVSSMDGLERTRLLRDLPVRIGDVKGQEDVGYIALAAVGSDGPERVRKGRLYD